MVFLKRIKKIGMQLYALNLIFVSNLKDGVFQGWDCFIFGAKLNLNSPLTSLTYSSKRFIRIYSKFIKK